MALKLGKPKIISFFLSILDKLVIKDGQEWCMDVFDQFVLAGQSVTVGEAVIRRYRPVSSDNDHIVLHIFSSERDDCKVSISCHKSDIFLLNAQLKNPTYIG